MKYTEGRFFLETVSVDILSMGDPSGNLFESEEAELTKTNHIINPLNEFRCNLGIRTNQEADKNMTNEDHMRSEDHPWNSYFYYTY